MSESRILQAWEFLFGAKRRGEEEEGGNLEDKRWKRILPLVTGGGNKKGNQ